MSKIYGNKDAKSCTTWSFPSYREDEIRWETCWYVWQTCRVLNSLNADTATWLDFTKIVPTKFHLWFRSSQFLFYPLVWMAPILKENRQLPDRRRSMNRESNGRANTRKHSTPPIMPSPGCTERNYFENWKRQKPHDALVFLQRSTESLGSHGECCKVFLGNTIRHHLASNPRYDQETFFKILYFLFYQNTIPNMKNIQLFLDVFVNEWMNVFIYRTHHILSQGGLQF